VWPDPTSFPTGSPLDPLHCVKIKKRDMQRGTSYAWRKVTLAPSSIRWHHSDGERREPVIISQQKKLFPEPAKS
jgi:hypothetical protein